MEFTLKVAGAAGQGTAVVGRTMGKLFTRGGLHVVGYPEYPSLIRGGHNTYQVHTSDEKIWAPTKTTDLVIALNKHSVLFHKDKISKNGGLIYDSIIDISKYEIRKDIKLFPLPLRKIVEETQADKRMANVIAMGATLALINYPLDFLNGAITDEFSRKGNEIINKNIEVAKRGFDYIHENFKNQIIKEVKPVSDKRKMFVGGNEAACLGAIKAGLKFYSGYPMTPASSVLTYLMTNERKAKIVTKHTEDEISAINYAVGAAYAGVRAMTGTSGGGFALMTETVGLSAIAETPLVIFLAQRVGPSTGMPTWTEQGDLRMVLHSSQGDFPRIILAPGDVDESIELCAKALNLAEKYQLPVFFINDKFLAESQFSSEFDFSKIKIERGKIARNLPELEKTQRYKRYLITEDGVSPRAFPGEPNGQHVASSYTHDETGFTTEDFSKRVEEVEKRNRKVPHILKDMELPKFYGPEDAKVTLVTWGSQKMPCMDAIKKLKKVNILHFTHLYPLDEKEVYKILKSCKKTIMVENNSSAQFAGVLREFTGWQPDFYLLRFDGRPLFPEEIIEKTEKLVKSKFKGERKIAVTEQEYEYYNPDRYTA